MSANLQLKYQIEIFKRTLILDCSHAGFTAEVDS